MVVQVLVMTLAKVVVTKAAKVVVVTMHANKCVLHLAVLRVKVAREPATAGVKQRAKAGARAAAIRAAMEVVLAVKWAKT